MIAELFYKIGECFFMNHNLEIFLKAKGYYLSGGFKQFIERNTSVTKIEGAEKYKYEFKALGDNPVHQIILNFLKQPQNKKFMDKFERNKEAEFCYVQEVKKTIVNKIKEKGRGEKIWNICYTTLIKDLPTTSIIKQCEKRYQQLISKVEFDSEQIELINIGMYFFTIIYYLAKQEKEKSKTTVEKKSHEELSTKSDKLDSILDNALSRIEPLALLYGKDAHYGKDAPYVFRARNYLEDYFTNRENF